MKLNLVCTHGHTYIRKYLEEEVKIFRKGRGTQVGKGLTKKGNEYPLETMPTESAKYLGVKIDANLSWQDRVNYFLIKVNRAYALPFKMGKYVSLKIIRSICIY